MNIQTLPDLLTKKELAKLLRCSVRTIENRVSIGLYKKHVEGGHVRFKRSDFPILNKTA